MRIAVYPGAIAIHTDEEIKKNIEEKVFPQIIKALTEPPAPEKPQKPARKAKERPFACEGTFEEVNQYFLIKKWSDGLPIVPPTEEKVAEFLKYTPLPADHVIGELHPSMNPATVKSIAINGVMAGCDPTYMPVLVATVEAIADHRYHLEDAGSSAGWAPMIMVNGPIRKKLDFNCSTGALRVGPQSNTSIGRFLRLYLRNVSGLIPGMGDMGTFGRPNMQVLAENEEESPWDPLHVTRGFDKEDSVVTVSSCGFMSYTLTVVAQTPEDLMKNLARKLSMNLIAGDGSIITKGDHQHHYGGADESFKGNEQAHVLGLSPVIANTIAEAGYSKKDVQNYIFEHSKVTAEEFDEWLRLQGWASSYELTERGTLPKQFGESDDPKRLVPLYNSPEELQIVVAGTTNRNRFFVIQQVGRQGLATSKKVDTSLLK